MKIAFVTASVSRKAGGLHESVRRLAQSIQVDASCIEVLALKDEYTDADFSKWAPIRTKTFPVLGPKQFGYAPGLLGALQNSDALLTMSHGLWMYPSAAVHKWHKKTGRPHIVHPHGMLDPWAVRNSGWKKRIAEVLYEFSHLESAACIRALCLSEADSIRAYGLRNPIAVIPNGIDLPDQDHKPQTPDGGLLSEIKASGRKVLLYLGRIHPKKGLVNLLRAWARIQGSQLSTLNSQLDEWVLAIAGWDQNSHEAELRRLATELSIRWLDTRDQTSRNSQLSILHPQLLFLGPQFNKGKAACYRNCDAFILPSLSEGLPMVILEAWAYAKPVLMTPECNLPAGFAAGAGLRVSNAIPSGAHPSRATSIEDGLRQLFELTEAERKSMGQQGRVLVAEEFSWPRIAQEMKAVYSWVLGSGPKPSSVS